MMRMSASEPKSNRGWVGCLYLGVSVHSTPHHVRMAPPPAEDAPTNPVTRGGLTPKGVESGDTTKGHLHIRVRGKDFVCGEQWQPRFRGMFVRSSSPVAPPSGCKNVLRSSSSVYNSFERMAVAASFILRNRPLLTRILAVALFLRLDLSPNMLYL